MINLNNYINKTVDFEIEKDKIHVKLPTCSILAEILKLENGEGSDVPGEDYKIKQKCAQLLLNNNTESRVFSDEEMDALPSDAVMAIYTNVMAGKLEADFDPNFKSQSLQEMSETPS